MFKAFDSRAVTKVKTRFGEFFARQGSTDLLAYLEEQDNASHISAMRNLITKTRSETHRLKLTTYKCLKLLLTFRSVLLNHQFSESVIKKLVGLLIKTMTQKITEGSFGFASITMAHRPELLISLFCRNQHYA